MASSNARQCSTSHESSKSSGSRATKLSAKITSKVKNLVSRFEGLGKKVFSRVDETQKHPDASRPLSVTVSEQAVVPDTPQALEPSPLTTLHGSQKPSGHAIGSSQLTSSHGPRRCDHATESSPFTVLYGSQKPSDHILSQHSTTRALQDIQIDGTVRAHADMYARLTTEQATGKHSPKLHTIDRHHPRKGSRGLQRRRSLSSARLTRAKSTLSISNAQRAIRKKSGNLLSSVRRIVSGEHRRTTRAPTVFNQSPLPCPENKKFDAYRSIKLGGQPTFQPIYKRPETITTRDTTGRPTNASTLWLPNPVFDQFDVSIGDFTRLYSSPSRSSLVATSTPIRSSRRISLNKDKVHILGSQSTARLSTFNVTVETKTDSKKVELTQSPKKGSAPYGLVQGLTASISVTSLSPYALVKVQSHLSQDGAKGEALHLLASTTRQDKPLESLKNSQVCHQQPAAYQPRTEILPVGGNTLPSHVKAKTSTRNWTPQKRVQKPGQPMSPSFGIRPLNAPYPSLRINKDTSEIGLCYKATPTGEARTIHTGLITSGPQENAKALPIGVVNTDPTPQVKATPIPAIELGHAKDEVVSHTRKADTTSSQRNESNHPKPAEDERRLANLYRETHETGVLVAQFATKPLPNLRIVTEDDSSFYDDSSFEAESDGEAEIAEENVTPQETGVQTQADHTSLDTTTKEAWWVEQSNPDTSTAPTTQEVDDTTSHIGIDASLPASAAVHDVAEPDTSVDLGSHVPMNSITAVHQAAMETDTASQYISYLSAASSPLYINKSTASEASILSPIERPRFRPFDPVIRAPGAIPLGEIAYLVAGEAASRIPRHETALPVSIPVLGVAPTRIICPQPKSSKMSKKMLDLVGRFE